MNTDFLQEGADPASQGYGEARGTEKAMKVYTNYTNGREFLISDERNSIRKPPAITSYMQ
jgi:hypothetical protein